MLANTAAPQPVRFVGEMLQGATKPVGSDGEGTIQVADPHRAWQDIKHLEARRGEGPPGGHPGSPSQPVPANP